MDVRHFGATAFFDKLLLDGRGDQLHIEDERVVTILEEMACHVRIEAVEALSDVLERSRYGETSIRLWILAESNLIEAARQIAI